jgi:hypothetical protein
LYSSNFSLTLTGFSRVISRVSHTRIIKILWVSCYTNAGWPAWIMKCVRLYRQKIKQVISMGKVFWLFWTLCVRTFVTLWRCDLTQTMTSSSSSSRFLDHTQWGSTVGILLLTSEQLVPQTSTWQHKTQQSNVRASSRIRPQNLGRRATSDLRFRPYGHCSLFITNTVLTNNQVFLFIPWLAESSQFYSDPSHTNVMYMCK